jgi:hypothetical protein
MFLLVGRVLHMMPLLCLMHFSEVMNLGSLQV